MTSLIVGLDRRTQAGWHANVLADDERDAVGAVIGPNSSVVADARS